MNPILKRLISLKRTSNSVLFAAIENNITLTRPEGNAYAFKEIFYKYFKQKFSLQSNFPETNFIISFLIHA